MIETQRKIGFWIFIACAFLLLFYALFQGRNLLLGPHLSISTPQEGKTSLHKLLTIKGRAKNISHLTINDQQVFTDENGSLEEQLLLPEGYTILVVKAEDRFGRHTKKIIPIYYHGEKEN